MTTPEVTALRARVAELEAQIAATEPELRRVAEQQREACARALEGPHRDPATGANCYSRAPLRGNGTPLDPCCGNCARAEVVRAATLVTEGEP